MIIPMIAIDEAWRKMHKYPSVDLGEICAYERIFCMAAEED